MVEVQYSEQASDLMEQFSLSTLIQDRRETIESFSGKERELFKDVFPIMEELRLLFQPYKEKMETYYLTGYGITLLQSCYLEMVDKGLTPKSVEAVHAYCLQLDAEAIREQLKGLLNTGPEHMAKSGDFWDYLEASSIKSETKWYFSQFYRKPLEAMKELIELSRELIPLYQPYLEKSAAERRAYAASFSLEDTIAESASLSHFDWNFKENQFIRLYVVSPWVVQFASYFSETEPKESHYFIVSCRIDQLLKSGKELDMDTFAAVLKVLSDSTRYNVMVELAKPYAKSKRIAEELDITGAAVSFHTQKLINAKLLLFNRDHKDVKYDVNKSLLREIIAKLTSDFGLGEK